MFLSKTDHISAFWDVMPTVADLAGIDPPKNIDGISFLPTLLNKDGQKEHDYMYWEFHEKGGRQAVRKGNWKYVSYGVLNPEMATVELYDLSTDIGEENNVAAEYPQIVQQIKAYLKTARTESANWPLTEAS